ncbi:serine hydrolase domain-containing protein [Agromyces aerolatus]|uniref:serine hydrolase domain-containing protein n=1 Tax=Agromyces sp. LY-1074 TaxID=3074080 RepID=UPI002860144E|nr:MULTISPECIES: serine hydrolase domain-containing protein [unclassified Agromyces]MDR5699415.1 serine hydrolase domain-containing protein [Agromyces sp. LY-1074]MDR5705711.1 serine hydrolase domain-containing protein [Agromyces sp. LY-1358]
MSSPALVTAGPGNRTPAEVDARLRRLVQRVSAPSRQHHVNLAVTSLDGQRRWFGGAGPAAGPAATDSDGTGPRELGPNSPFFTASITKRFIITLVLQAHERGELDLDAPITAYLPASITTGLHVRGRVDRTPEITVRHLASHTSGLPDFFERRRGGPSLYRRLRAGDDQAWGFDDVLEITRAQQHPHFDPQDLAARRQKAQYSDTGFQLLIRILEHVTSTPFADLLGTRITEPLGLTRTWHPSTRPADQSAPAPWPLYVGRRPVSLPATMAASHDLFSTTADLIAFERALTAGEPFHDPETRHLLTERRNRLRNAPVLGYGLGTMFFTVNRLMLPKVGPVTLVGHSGSTGTWLFTCPELGVHLAGTVDQTQAQSLPFRIMARCLQIWTR